MTKPILFDLRERVKELTCLHGTARLLQDVNRPTAELMPEVVNLIPTAWQYPEIAAARVRFCNRGWHTPRFRITPWTQEARFQARNGRFGTVEVAYLEERPLLDEGPFLFEERDLICSLAEMLRSHFDHVLADDELRGANDALERQVRERTAELEREVAEHRLTARKLAVHGDQLRRLAAEISLTEARERRSIASDLHDHIGQALAFTKMHISQFRTNPVFCGHEHLLDRIVGLLDQTIAYTRDLTVKISPPVLYELGLAPALEWLGDRVGGQTGITIPVSCSDLGNLPEELTVMLFKSTQELLANAAKHSGSDTASITARIEDDCVLITVSDSGRGFDPEAAMSGSESGDSFGLFSIRERLRQSGGELLIDTQPGRGADLTLSAPINGGRV